MFQLSRSVPFPALRLRWLASDAVFCDRNVWHWILRELLRGLRGRARRRQSFVPGRSGFAGFQGFGLARQGARRRAGGLGRRRLPAPDGAAPARSGQSGIIDRDHNMASRLNLRRRGKAIGPDERVERDSVTIGKDCAHSRLARRQPASRLARTSRRRLAPRAAAVHGDPGRLRHGIGAGHGCAERARLHRRDRHRSRDTPGRRGRRLSAPFAEVWKGLDKGSLRRSELAQPASMPAAAPVKARRNAKRARETQTKSLMTQPTDTVSFDPLSAD